MPTRIAISMRVMPQTARGEIWDCSSQDWLQFLAPWGAHLFPVPNEMADPDGWVEQLRPDAVILSGGNTVGRDGVSGDDVFPGRDRTESALVRYAEKHKAPLLGVCRGFQFLNHYLGGNISADFSSRAGIGNHVGNHHEIELKDPNWEKYADGRVVSVNSFHDDVILATDLAQRLRAVAVADCGATVEAAVCDDLPFVGIMWHLERDNRRLKLDRFLIDILCASRR